MIEKFIHNLQIQLGLDKDCVVFPDQRITSPKNRESFVFKTDKFIALTGSSGWRIGLDPVIAINIDNAKNTGRLPGRNRFITTELIIDENQYEISSSFELIITNLDSLNKDGILIVCTGEDELTNNTGGLFEKLIKEKGFSINAVIGLNSARSFGKKYCLNIISKSCESLFIAEINEDESNSDQILKNYISETITSKKRSKTINDIYQGYLTKRNKFLGLYEERIKFKISKITAFDKGFKTCAFKDVLETVTTGIESSKITNKDNSLFIKNRDGRRNYDSINTEEDWVKTIATLDPENHQFHQYFYVTIDKNEISAEYLVIFLRSYLGRELYKLAPKSKHSGFSPMGNPLPSRMTKKDLKQLQIYYPDLATQNSIIEANLQLNKLQDSLNLFNEGLSSNPNKLIGESSDQIQELLGVVGKLNSAERIRNHIRKIETGYSEFKETWRFPVDFEGNKIKKDFEKRAENMTPDIFKVINSFLNSYGGDLMIGINDRSHEPRGIEKEIDHYWGYKESEHFACLEKFEDEFKKTLKSCIDKKYIGEEKNIFWEFVPYEGCTVFLIRCRQSSSRCYLKHDSNIRKKLGHAFYHRLGNDSEPIDSDEERDKFWSDRSTKDNQI
ncbi:ATP-binding protein [Candidatus Thioglobus sp.]|nr:ATP-binding protein [Candidatus Thioglobus sp.]